MAAQLVCWESGEKTGHSRNDDGNDRFQRSARESPLAVVHVQDIDVLGDYVDNSLNEIDAVFLDLDGTIYLGGELIPGALEFLQRCNDRGVKRFFLSNNSSRSVNQYLEKLQGFGIPAEPADVLLSTHDLLSWLNKNNITKTWLIGTDGMKTMLEVQGIVTAVSYTHLTLPTT